MTNPLAPSLSWASAVLKDRSSKQFSLGLMDTPLRPRDSHVSSFAVVERNATTLASRKLLESTLHMLAQDDLLYRLAQELHQLACPPEVAIALRARRASPTHHGPPPSDNTVRLGLLVADSIQAVACASTCLKPRHDVFDGALELMAKALGINTDIGVMFRVARTALLTACVCVDPASAALHAAIATNDTEDTTLPTAATMPLGLLLELYGGELTARTLIVRCPRAGGPLHVRSDGRVELGAHTYTVRCIVRDDSVTVGDDVVRLTAPFQPLYPSSSSSSSSSTPTTYVQEATPCTLFLVRQ